MPVWDGRRDNWSAGIGAVARLAAAELRLLKRPLGEFDALLVGYPGQFDLPAARLAARGRPIVFNPLVSLSDTFVADRGRFFLGVAASGHSGRGVLRKPDHVAGHVARLPSGAPGVGVPLLVVQALDQSGEGFVFGETSGGNVRAGEHGCRHAASVRCGATPVDSLGGNGLSARPSLR